MKYILVEWPDIQNYMNNPNFKKEVGFDPVKNTWYVPETWINDPYAHLSDKELKEIFEDIEADTYLSCGIW